MPTAKATPEEIDAFLRHHQTAVTVAKRTKYRAIPTEYNGVRYASKAEAAYAHLLDLTPDLWWVGQPKFRLGVPENVYIADFLVVPQNAPVYVVDVKGARTAKFKRDVRLWERYGPCKLLIVSGKKQDIITPRVIAL